MVKRIGKIASLCLLIVIIAAIFCGCSTASGEVKSVDIRLNSFKTTYNVDEKPDLSAAYIIVTYTDGNTASFVIDNNMLKGFDTSTTGSKTLYAEYMGIKSGTVGYEVVYNHAANAINTDARLKLLESDYSTGSQYQISLKIGSLAKVSALSFTLQSVDLLDELGISEGSLYLSTDLVGWQFTKKIVSSKELRVLLFNADGSDLTENAVIMTMIITNNLVKDAEVIVDYIELTDGENKYSLPYCQKGRI